MKYLISIIAVFFWANVVFADVQAVSYFVIKTDSLKELIKKNTNLENIPYLVLEDISIAKGYFDGECNLYLKTKDHQYRLKVWENENKLNYKFRMYSQANKKMCFQQAER